MPRRDSAERLGAGKAPGSAQDTRAFHDPALWERLAGCSRKYLQRLDTCLECGDYGHRGCRRGACPCGGKRFGGPQGSLGWRGASLEWHWTGSHAISAIGAPVTRSQWASSFDA